MELNAKIRKLEQMILDLIVGEVEFDIELWQEKYKSEIKKIRDQNEL